MQYIVRSVDGDEYGPFDRKELQRLVGEQRLGPGDFIRRENGRTWSPFEKIAGLSDETDESNPGAVNTPVRPRVDPQPEVLGLEEDSTSHPSPILPRTRIDAPASEPGIRIDFADPGESRIKDPFERPGDESQPNPFTRLGLPITLEDGEQVRFVIIQSFLDALRESPLNAILGHRGTLVCTDARVVVARPSLIRPSMAIAWLSSAGGASLETRRRFIRMLFGVAFLFYAFSILLSGPMTNAALGALGGPPGASVMSGLTFLVGGLFGILGVLFLVTASARSLVVTANGPELIFGCSRIGPWHLAQVDAAHEIAYRKSHPGNKA